MRRRGRPRLRTVSVVRDAYATSGAGARSIDGEATWETSAASHRTAAAARVLSAPTQRRYSAYSSASQSHMVQLPNVCFYKDPQGGTARLVTAPRLGTVGLGPTGSTDAPLLLRRGCVVRSSYKHTRVCKSNGLCGA